MGSIFDYIHNPRSLFYITFDMDSVDRLKYAYTPLLLFGLAAFTFTRNYVGQPMQCWVPNQFNGGWEQYVESYCFVEGTYFVNHNETNLPDVQRRDYSKIPYYQWVPFILALVGILLYIPRVLWKMFQKRYAKNLADVTGVIRSRTKKLDNVKVNFQDDISPKWLQRNSKMAGNEMTRLFVLTKILAIFIIVGLVLFIEWFLFGKPLSYMGVQLLDSHSTRRWDTTGKFPRVTFCDFQVRELGQVHRWSVQCVLMVNMFNEKIFLFTWFFLLAVLFICFINLVKWMFRLSYNSHITYLRQVINSIDTDDTIQVRNEDLVAFHREILKTDGIIVLRLIQENTNIYQAANLIKKTWADFVEFRKPKFE